MWVVYLHTVNSVKVTVGLLAVEDSVSGTEAAVTASEQPWMPLSSCPETPIVSLTAMRAFESEVVTTILEDALVNWQELSPVPPTISNEALSRIPERAEEKEEQDKNSRRKG